MPAPSFGSSKLFCVVVSTAALCALGSFACSSSSSSGTNPTDGGSEDASDAGSSDDGGGGSDASEPFDANGPHATIRVMTGNLTSGDNQNYNGGEGARIFEGIHADVILIQEFQVGSVPTDIDDFVHAICGADCNYYRQAGATIPNGVITKFPIVSSGFWDDPKTTAGDRDFAWAQIDIPGPRDLWAVSVHLLTSSSTNRNDQATALIGYIQANVPAGAYVVIGGDFNTDTRDEAAVGTLGNVVTVDPPWPADGSGDENTNAPRSHPYDYVVASPDLAAGMIPVQIGAQSFAGGLVVDTRVYTPIDDLAPALSTDSAATNMQHMAVVRDFLVAE